MKKHILYAITLVIAGLLITSAVGITASENINNTKEKDIISKVKLETQDIEANPVQIASSHDIYEFSSFANTGTIGEDNPIMYAADEFDIVCPGLMDDGGGNVIAIGEGRIDFGTSSPLVRYSNDGGETWLPETSFLGWENMDGYIEEKPVLDFAGDRGGFGSMIPYDPKELFTVEIDDVSDPEAGDKWVIWGWLTDDDIDSCDACGTPSVYAPHDDARGIVFRTGDAVEGYDNIYFYGWREGETLSGAWSPSLEWEAENAAIDSDITTGKFYRTYEAYNFDGRDGVYMSFCQLDGTNTWWQGDWFWLGDIIEGAINPDIKTDDGNCYLVYELEGSIMCTYTNNDGENWNTVEITNDGNLPVITAIGTTAVCTYTRDGDLYASISEDGGENWVETSAVNDESGSVEEQENGQVASGGYVAWTDNRIAPPFGVMFDTLGLGDPPSAPVIEGSTTGNPGVAINFKFTSTDPNGNQVSYFIDWDDGETSGYTPLQASGTPYSESHIWTEAGTYTIKAKAKNENGLTGPVSTHELTIEKSKAIVFNPWFLQFLQQFPLLKFILGI